MRNETPLFPNYRWLSFAVFLVGAFLPTLDFNIVNIAIPAIKESLKAEASEIELIISGYGTAYAVGLITGGRLGDLFGRKRIFMIGLLSFAVASAFCGFAPTPHFLILARIFQGIAAALMFPQTLSYIQNTFSKPDERGLAFGIFGMTLGLGNISGNLLSGVLTELNFMNLGWRPIFLINIPIVVLTFIAGRIFISESKKAVSERLDIGGVLLLSLTISLFIYPLSVGRELHWPLWTYCSFLASPIFLSLFLIHQKRKTRLNEFPLIDFSLFYGTTFLRSLIVGILFWLSLGAFLFMLAIYFQLGLGLTPFQAGMMFCPFAICYVLASFASGRFVKWIGRGTVSLGTFLMMLATCQLIWVASLYSTEAPQFYFIFAVSLYGIGQGLTQSPLIAAVLSDINSKLAGSASGILSTIQQLSYVVGITLMGSLFFSKLGESPKMVHYSHALVFALSANLGLLVLTFFSSFYFLPQKVKHSIPEIIDL